MYLKKKKKNTSWWKKSDKIVATASRSSAIPLPPNRLQVQYCNPLHIERHLSSHFFTSPSCLCANIDGLVDDKSGSW